MSHLYLIGFLESGNLTLGKQLAERLNRPFVDAETQLAEFLDKDLVTAWNEYGEDAFYRHQHDQLQTIAARTEPHVVSVGDNAALQHRDWELLKSTGKTVYLQHTPERLYWRLRHDPKRPPLVHVLEQERRDLIEAMMTEREPDYLKSDLVIDCGHKEVPDLINIIDEWLTTQN